MKIRITQFWMGSGNVELLPNRISTVDEFMLPHQPLCFALAYTPEQAKP